MFPSLQSTVRVTECEHMLEKSDGYMRPVRTTSVIVGKNSFLLFEIQPRR
jgi:hypothetical protein